MSGKLYCPAALPPGRACNWCFKGNHDKVSYFERVFLLMTHVKCTLINKTKLDILSTHDRIGHSQDLYCRSQWPRGLRRRSAAARLLRSWVRIPPGAWMFVCFECCVLSGRGLCDELITRPEESYRLWCVVVCNFETSWMRSQNKAGWTAGRRLQQTENVAV